MKKRSVVRRTIRTEFGELTVRPVKNKLYKKCHGCVKTGAHIYMNKVSK